MNSFAGLSPGEYKNEEGETVELTPEELLRYPAQNVLYGSTTAINREVVKIMEVTGRNLGDAIRMAGTNPACPPLSTILTGVLSAIWVFLWLRTYKKPENHSKLSKEELAYSKLYSSAT